MRQSKIHLFIDNSWKLLEGVAVSKVIAARWMRGPQSVGYLPDTSFGIVRRFEFPRVVQGRLALLMSSTSFCKSSREGFWPEMVRKKTGSWATSFSSLRI